MTVIACRVNENTGDIEIASDSQTTLGQTISIENTNWSKLFESENGIVVGCAGLVQEALLLKLYLKKHKPLDNSEDGIVDFFDGFYTHLSDRTNEYTRKTIYIFLMDGKAYEVYDYCITQIKSYTAIGSGMEYALAAMYLGNSAEKAVETATALNIYCEMPIIKFKMNGVDKQ